jgi:hypothetical protein
LEQEANGQVSRKKTNHRSSPHQLALPLNFAKQTWVVCFSWMQFNDYSSIWLELIFIQPYINAQDRRTSLRDDGDIYRFLHYLFSSLPTLPTALGQLNRAH